MIGISVAITSHNEGLYLRGLLDDIARQIGPNDEIVLLDDYSNDIDTVLAIQKYSKAVVFANRKLDGDFAKHKNYLNSLCSKEWILQIDADERVPFGFIDLCREVIEANQDVDAFRIPRINTVEGITAEHVERWGWRINEAGWINWPDYQTRLYCRSESIVWRGKVHEQLIGMSAYATMPAKKEYAIIHAKEISRQERQNSLYDAIYGGGMTGGGND